MMPCAKYMHSGDSHPPSTPNDTRLVALHLTHFPLRPLRQRFCASAMRAPGPVLYDHVNLRCGVRLRDQLVCHNFDTAI